MASKKRTGTEPARAEERKILSVQVSESMHRRVKVHAAMEGKKLSDVFNEALDEYLKKRGA